MAPIKPHKLSKAQPIPDITAEWIRELSVERYRPMLRLLDDSDLEFLCRQPGFDRKMAARLRRQRCQIFSGYLTSLGEDFRKVCGALGILLLHSSCDRPDLARLLARRQVAFRLCMFRVRWRLLLYRWGAGCVDIRCLMSLFDNACGELQGLVPGARTQPGLRLVLPPRLSS